MPAPTDGRGDPALLAAAGPNHAAPMPSSKALLRKLLV